MKLRVDSENLVRHNNNFFYLREQRKEKFEELNQSISDNYKTAYNFIRSDAS